MSAGACGFVLCFWGQWVDLSSRSVQFGFTSLAVGFAGLLLFLLFGEASLLGKALSLGPVRYIGRISYGIYLLHYGLISVLDRLLHYRFMAGVSRSWMLVILMRLALTLGVAALSYRFFESPILRLKDRLRVKGPRDRFPLTSSHCLPGNGWRWGRTDGLNYSPGDARLCLRAAKLSGLGFASRSLPLRKGAIP